MIKTVGIVSLSSGIMREEFVRFEAEIGLRRLHEYGLSVYGQSFLADVCELGPQMLPHSRKYFEELISTGKIREIVPSETWYEDL